MNILFLIDYDINTSGGTQTSVNAQRSELKLQGHSVTLLCPAQTHPVGRSDDHAHYLPALPLIQPNGFAVVSPLIVTTRYLQKVISSYEKFDLIHCQSDGLLSHHALPLAKKLRIPLIQTMHGRDDVFFESTIKLPTLASSFAIAFDYLRTRIRPQLKETGGMSRTAKNMWSIMMSRCIVADAVTIPSHHLTELFIHHGLDPKKVHTISNGLKDEVIDQATTLGIAAGAASPLRIIWAGRISHEKQPILFLEMLSRLTVPFIASMYGEGEQLETCQSFIKAHRLSENVTIHGKYDASDIIDIMQAHDVLVYTSNGFDNQPMVMLEAVAAELPVVFCDPKLAECMPSAGAILSETPSSASLVDAITRLTRDDSTYKNLKKGMRDGKDSIRQSIQTKKMVDVYRTAIKQEIGKR